MIDSGGCLVQAPTPASASEALISLRKSRRPFGSFHSEACAGNSRWRYSRNSGVSASSPRLLQYMRPSAPARRERIAEKSMIELSMTGRAARELVDAADLVFL